MRSKLSADPPVPTDAPRAISELAKLHDSLWGDADRFQKVHYGERLGAGLGTELTRIAGGKHFTPEDHPKEIAEAINELASR